MNFYLLDSDVKFLDFIKFLKLLLELFKYNNKINLKGNTKLIKKCRVFCHPLNRFNENNCNNNKQESKKEY